MNSFHTVQEQDLRPDGQLRRKYDLDDEAQPKKAKHAFKGLLSLNVLFILQQLMFWLKEDEEKKAAQASDEAEQPDKVDDPDLELKSSDLMEEEQPPETNEIAELANFLDPLLKRGGGSRFNRGDDAGFDKPGFEYEPIRVLVSPLEFEARNVIPLPIQTSSFLPRSDTAFSAGPGGGADDRPGPIDPDPFPPPDDPRKGPNRLPVSSGTVHLNSMYLNQAILIGLADLLRGIHDPNGDPMSVEQLAASSGTLTATADGWMFKSEHGDVSDVTFTYQVSDGEGAIAQLAYLDILPIPGAHIMGTEGDDLIIGTAGNDRIEAKGGNDTIIAREGSDLVDAGSGDDRIIGSEGADLIYAGPGNDVVFAGDGDDVVFGGDGDDFLYGQAGNDTLEGEAGNDTLIGGDGDDHALGGAGNDLIYGDTGADFLDGGTGDDVMYGGLGNDVLVTDAGSDQAFGEAGDDTFVALPGDGDDTLDGGTGTDTLDLSGTDAPAEVDLEKATAESADIGTDNVISIENVVGSRGDDEITGSDADNVLTGGTGDDRIEAGAGDDTIVATKNDGNDRIDGGEGVDTYDLSQNTTPTVVNLADGTAWSAETGTDELSDVENVITGTGDDLLTGDQADNTLVGGAGNDTYDFSGSSHDAVVDLGAGVATGDDIGTDTLIDIENVVAGAGDDTLTGGVGSNTLVGNDGNDTFHAAVGDGNDTYVGGAGTDTYDLSATSAGAVVDLNAGTASSGDTGYDTLSGIENVSGSQGNDVIVANDESNSLYGNGGNDVFVFLDANAADKGSQKIHDRIEDFEVGDKIDLSKLDGNKDDDGWQRVVYEYDKATFDGVGQVILRYRDDEAGTTTVLQFNLTDANKKKNDKGEDEHVPDYEIELVGRHEINDNNFVI